MSIMRGILPVLLFVVVAGADALPNPTTAQTGHLLHQHRLTDLSTWWSCYVDLDDSGQPTSWSVAVTPVVSGVGVVPAVLAPWAAGEGARAVFNDTYDAVGWSFLQVVSNPDASNEAQATAAGYLEGKLSATRIFQYAMSNGGNETNPQPIQEFIDASRGWIDEQVEINGRGDDYWTQVNLWRIQLEGVVQGYQAGCSGAECTLSTDAIFNLNVANSISTLGTKFNVAPPSAVMDQHPVLFSGDAFGHCTGFVKLTPSGELLIGHDTWSNFNSMMRVYKYMDMAFRRVDGSVVPGRRQGFSSYPGILYSGDDYYTLSSGLVVAETTIGTNNATQYNAVVPETVFEEARNIIANRLAASGDEWASFFGAYNSGCYNNQFYIVDYSRFTLGESLQPGTLTVVEQLPGFMQAEDVTPLLSRQGYFGSYNIPMFPETIALSNMSGLVNQYGTWFLYNGTARALIMDRDHNKVVGVEEMKAFMRYNDFKHDPLARCPCNPPYTGENAIACRSDLNPANGTWNIPFFGQRNHAAIDSKFTTSAMFADGQASWIISSPTYDQQPVFVWSTSPYANSPHAGQPDRFEFPWVTAQFPAMPTL